MNDSHSAKRYLYLVAGTIIMLFLGLIYAWSIFRAPFSEIFPSWSLSNLSMTFTISMIFFCVGGFTGGNLTKVLKNRYIVLISAALLCIGFFFVSRLDAAQPEQSLIKLYIFYGVFCGSGVGIGYNAVVSAVVKWFPDKTGFASGILLMGYGLGGMVLGSAVNVLVASTGLLQSFFILSIVIVIVLFAGSFFIKMPDAVSSGAAAAKVNRGRDYTPSQMIRTPSFWIFFLWNVIISAAGLLVINSAATIALAFGAPAVLGLIVSVFNGFGRVAFGGLMDKIGRNTAMYLNCCVLLVSGICLYTGAVTQNVMFIFAGLLLVGLSFGGSPSFSSAVINKFFGAKNYPVNFGINNFLIIPAAIIGPMISSALQERSNGAYDSTFIMIIGFAVVAFAINAVLNKVSAHLVSSVDSTKQ